MYLYGAGGHCKAIIDMVISDLDLTITGIFDDNNVHEVLGHAVVKPQNLTLGKDDQMHICIGDNKTRKEVAGNFKTNFPTLIHPSSFVSTLSDVGDGTVVMSNASIKAVTTIGRHCIINAGAIIGHDVTVEDYVHIAPNSAVAGFVTIGEGAHIGLGASVIQRVTIGKWAIIGAGAVVIRDVPDYAVVVGNPAKIIKYNNEHIDTTP